MINGALHGIVSPSAFVHLKPCVACATAVHQNTTITASVCNVIVQGLKERGLIGQDFVFGEALAIMNRAVVA